MLFRYYDNNTITLDRKWLKARWISRNLFKTKSQLLKLMDFGVNRQGAVISKHKPFNRNFIH